MEFIPDNSFTPPSDGSSANALGGVLFAVGMAIIGGLIVYHVRKKYRDQFDK